MSDTQSLHSLASFARLNNLIMGHEPWSIRYSRSHIHNTIERFFPTHFYFNKITRSPVTIDLLQKTILRAFRRQRVNAKQNKERKGKMNSWRTRRLVCVCNMSCKSSASLCVCSSKWQQQTIWFRRNCCVTETVENAGQTKCVWVSRPCAQYESLFRVCWCSLASRWI